MALGACFVCMAMAMDSEQVAQFPWAPVPASPWGYHIGKRRGGPGETAPSLWIEVQLGSVSIPSVRLSCPLSAELQPQGLKPTPAGFSGTGSREEIESCCDTAKLASTSSSPGWVRASTLSCHIMPCCLSLRWLRERETALLQEGWKVHASVWWENRQKYPSCACTVPEKALLGML